MNQQPINQISNSDDDEIDILELLSTLFESKWKILSFSLLSLILAFLFAFGKQAIYKADSLLRVEAKSSAIPGIGGLAGLGSNISPISTQLEIIKSRKILGKAVIDLNLDIVASPKRIPLFGNISKHFFFSDSLDKPFSYLSDYAWGNEKIQVARFEVENELLNKSFLIISKDDNQYDLFLEDQHILSGMVGKYALSKDKKVSINVSELIALPGTKFSLSKRSYLKSIESLKSTISISEKGKGTGIISLQMEGQDKNKIVEILKHISNNFLEQNKTRSSKEAANALAFLKEQIKPIKEKADIAEANIKRYRIDHQTADMSIETQGILKVVTDIDTQLQGLSMKRDELAQRYTSNHPVLKSIRSQEEKLQERRQKTVSKITKLPETQQELLNLQRKYKVAYAIYNNLLNNIQEFKIAQASTVGNIYILDTAVAHEKPVKPRKMLIVSLGLILGTMIGMLFVFIKKALHKTIDNPEKLEDLLKIPVYATVPFTKDVSLSGGFKKNKRQKSLLAFENSNDPAIESLRSLRTSLHFALLEAKNNIVMITGPAPGIGKSFISSNFSAVIASSEQRVLLIDADMRKGYLHELLGKEISPGLSDLITEKATIEDSIHSINSGESKFDILTRGMTPPNPSELLMHSNFEALLNKLSDKYDLILIDTPPVHAVTDPTIIGALSGVVFMVVRSDQHSMKEIEHAVTRLSHTGIETKGFIFNGYEAKKKGSYGYHSYYGDYTSDT